MWYASFASIKKFFHLSLITVNDHYNIIEDNNIIWVFWLVCLMFFARKYKAKKWK